MGLLSSPKASGSKSTSASHGTAIISGAQISLRLLDKAMDGVNIPFVKGVAGIGVEVIQIAKAIQTNREECDILIKRSTSLLIVILSSFSGKTEADIPDHLRKAVERLTSSFQDVLAELRIIDKRAGKQTLGGLARSILYYVDNGEKLKGCSAKLDWAMGEFQVTSKVDSCLKDLERHDELRKGQEAIRNELSEIRGVMKEQFTPNASSNLPSTAMPPDSRIFGRQEYSEKAVKLLLSAPGAKIVILGPGGMGKTSVALKVIHDPRLVDLFGEFRCWIPCEQATSVPLFIELVAKSLNVPSSSSNDRLTDIIVFLKNSKLLYILLLDNFETPWDIEGQQSSVADVLTVLASIPTVSLLITMRGNQPPSSNTIDWTEPRLPSLSQLDLDAAEEAFLKISPSAKGDQELRTLLQKLDCMPLAITLMAKLSEAGETILELLEQWKTERTRLLDRPGGDRRNSIEVSIKLSLDSHPVKGTPDAIQLLSVLAMLPAGAALIRLPEMCPSITGWKAALRVLRGAALVYDSADKSRIQMLSPIQSYILLHHPLKQDSLKDLRASYYKLAPKGKTGTGHPEFREIAKQLAKEETNMEAILINALHDANGDREEAIQASLDYSDYLCYRQPRAEVIAEAERVARTIGSDRLPDCLLYHASILRRQGKADAAESLFEGAREEYTKLGDHAFAASCQRELGSILVARKQYESAREMFRDARDTLLKLSDADDAAWCLWDTGQSFYVQGEYPSACTAYEQARVEFDDIGNRPGSLRCLMLLGATLGCQGDYDQAQSYLEEARLAYIELDDPYNIACCLCYLGDVHRFAGNYSLARTRYDDALTMFMDLQDAVWIATCKRFINEVDLVMATH